MHYGDYDGMYYNYTRYRFYGDYNKELWHIQHYLYRSLDLHKKLIWASRQVFLCSCKNIATKESFKLIEDLKINQTYDPDYFQKSDNLISAIYRYEHGSMQLDLFKDLSTEFSIEHAMSLPDFDSYFKDYEIRQWRHFFDFEMWYENIVHRLVQHSSIVSKVMNIILNGNSKVYNSADKEYVPLEDLIAIALDIKSDYIVNLDFSDYYIYTKKQNTNWSKLSHPYLNYYTYNSRWYDSDYEY